MCYPDVLFEPGYEGPESGLRLVFGGFWFSYFLDKFMAAPGDTIAAEDRPRLQLKKITTKNKGSWRGVAT